MDTLKKVAVCILLLIPIEFYAQEGPLNKISDSLDKYGNQVFQEKVFVHTDRSVYITGENLFFKIYLVDGIKHNPVNLSKVAYLELIDFDSTSKVETRVNINSIGGDGSIYLPASLNSGKYILRVYTRWMRNFNVSYFFSKSITVINPFKPLLASSSADSSYDIQFFPEGGNLVQSIESKVGFRMVDQAGKGASFNGILINTDGDTIVHFSPLKFGIGHFVFTTEKGKDYIAHIFDNNGALLAQKTLPKVQEAGYSISLKPNDTEKLSLTVHSSGPDYNMLPVYLIVHCRGELILTDYKVIDNNKTEFILNVNDFKDGINHLTLFNNLSQPVCERLFFNKPENVLDIKVKPDKNTYPTRKKITIDIKVNNAEKAQLSMSVYRLDSLQPEEKNNIQNYLLLSSDLKGSIESPWYYFSEDVQVRKAVDNLMLTHGWRKFEWEDIISNSLKDRDYIPEYRGPFIEANLLHKDTNEPLSGLDAYLSTIGKDFVLRGSKSKENGAVLFEMNNFYKNGEIILQADPSVDSILNIQFIPPFSQDYFFPEPYNFNIDISYKSLIEERSIGMQLKDIFYEDQVAFYLKDSLPFYGVPDEQYFLDDFTRFPVMEEVIREYVRGVSVRKSKGYYKFQVNNVNAIHQFDNNPLVLVDGVPIFNMDKVLELDPLKIERIDVKTRKEFLGPLSFEGIVSFVSYDGDLMNQIQIDNKALILEYKGLQRKRVYFTPKYESENTSKSRLPDFRDLLYWNPNITIDGSEQSQISFYSSDRLGKYHILINGVSSDGTIGFGSSMIEVVETENP